MVFFARMMTLPMNSKPQTTQAPPRIAIIGTGFGGIGLAIRLKKAGFSNFILFEKAGDVGGVWRDNTYPGAACDVPSHLYSFSFEQDLGWLNRYGKAAEIHQYLRHCTDKYDLRPHILFNTEITAASFDDTTGLWTLQTSQGETCQANVTVAAVGQLNRPAYPKLTGMDSFAGKSFHSARWDHDYDLTGKRVAVIGTGASAIQFVPEIVPQVAHLDLYQRSAPYVIPKPDKAYPPLEKALFKHVPLLQSLDRAWQYSFHEVRLLGFTASVNETVLVEYLFQKHIREVIKDHKLRHRLTPDYPIGCKRILVSNDWYKTLLNPKIDIVSEDIAEIVPQGIRTADGKVREVDAIIYGTGFAATDFLAPMHISGLNGQVLKQTWQQGAEAYLGLTVHGFPNLFMLYGPNTNLGHSSIVYMLESQFNYVLDALKKLQQNSLRYLNVKQDIQTRFNGDIQQRMKKTMWAQGCSSWYVTAEGKNTNNWPGFTFDYRERTRKLNLDDYDLRKA